MIDHDLKPLPPDLEVLLECERRPPEPAPEVRSRVRARLAITLGVAGLGGSAAAASAPASAPAAAAPTTAPWLGSPALFKLGAGLVGALVLGTGTYLALRPGPTAVPPPPVASSPGVPLAQPLPKEPAPVVPAPTPLENHPTGQIAADAPTLSPGVSPHHHPATPTPEALAAERALLDRARTALMQGDMGQTLKLTAHHAHLFPHGQLAEERDSLAIRALAQKGELDTARARALQFRARYPHSIFLPALETALDSPQ
ncbi:MAG TPA: hypothetical protein VH877_31300 [Polyangia bacterium]|jgi:hypothetical protein|nr:hypothetical protein [Polyangia bacterium]